MQLHHEEEGHGPPLVLIAGYTRDLGQWAAVRPKLAAHHRLVLLDNRDAGHSGSSDATGYSIAEMAADTAETMHRLGLEKAHVLGHSMGGAIAQTLATDHPQLVDRLIISNSFPKFRAAPAAAFKWLLSLREEGHSAASVCSGAIPWVHSNRFLSSSANIGSAIAEMLANPHPQTLAGQARQFQALAGFDSRPWLKKISTPTLVIAGEEDLCAPPADARALADGIPGARLVVLPEAAHVPQEETPEGFARLVLDFLR